MDTVHHATKKMSYFKIYKFTRKFPTRAICSCRNNSGLGRAGFGLSRFERKVQHFITAT